jgi:hypothetical protein
MVRGASRVCMHGEELSGELMKRGLRVQLGWFGECTAGSA